MFLSLKCSNAAYVFTFIHSFMCEHTCKYSVLYVQHSFYYEYAIEIYVFFLSTLVQH